MLKAEMNCIPSPMIVSSNIVAMRKGSRFFHHTSKAAELLGTGTLLVTLFMRESNLSERWTNSHERGRAEKQSRYAISTGR